MAQIVVYLFLHAVFRHLESGAVLAAFPKAAAHLNDLFHIPQFHRRSQFRRRIVYSARIPRPALPGGDG
jgi:hypothetical protein